MEASESMRRRSVSLVCSYLTHYKRKLVTAPPAASEDLLCSVRTANKRKKRKEKKNETFNSHSKFTLLPVHTYLLLYMHFVKNKFGTTPFQNEVKQSQVLLHGVLKCEF